jgi:hypothetical protein
VTSVNRHRVFQSGAATALAIVIAANLSAAPAEEIVSTSVSCPSTKAFTGPLSGPHWNGWGVDLSQRRFQPADMAQLAAEDVPKLKLAGRKDDRGESKSPFPHIAAGPDHESDPRCGWTGVGRAEGQS